MKIQLIMIAICITFGVFAGSDSSDLPEQTIDNSPDCRFADSQPDCRPNRLAHDFVKNTLNAITVYSPSTLAESAHLQAKEWMSKKAQDFCEETLWAPQFASRVDKFLPINYSFSEAKIDGACEVVVYGIFTQKENPNVPFKAMAINFKVGRTPLGARLLDCQILEQFDGALEIQKFMDDNLTKASSFSCDLNQNRARK